MEGSKAEQQLADLDAVMSAIAHASRRQILLVLHFRGGEMTAGENAARFSCSWPTTTRHFGVLREAGLIDVERAGRARVYRLNLDRLKGVVGNWLTAFKPT